MILECAVFLLTATCADDWARWDDVPDPDLNRYRIEFYVDDTLSWSAEPLESEFLVGCTSVDGEIRVWAIDHAENWSPEPATLAWAANPGRYMDWSNLDVSSCVTLTPEPHCLAPACGGP